MYKTHEQPSFLDASNAEVRRATWCQFLAPVIGTSSWHQLLVPGFLAPIIGTSSWCQVLAPGAGATLCTGPAFDHKWRFLAPVTGTSYWCRSVAGACSWRQVLVPGNYWFHFVRTASVGLQVAGQFLHHLAATAKQSNYVMHPPPLSPDFNIASKCTIDGPGAWEQFLHHRGAPT